MNSSHFEDLTGNLRKVLAEAEALLKTAAAGAGDEFNGAPEHAGVSLRRDDNIVRTRTLIVLSTIIDRPA